MCGSLSITTPVSLLANELNVRSELHRQVSLAAAKQICAIHEAKILNLLQKCKYLKMTGTSCPDDARIKVPLFQKVTFFLIMKYSTEMSFICVFFFVCLKMTLTAVIIGEQASSNLLQSDSSFMLRNSM